jgi:pimeloyl-ACP methyl ester carboxylesterase
MLKTFIAKTQDGIKWYCEQQGSGPNLILIPSGEGDCFSFSKTASLLSTTFTVTTFDTPGFSRTTAPDSIWENFTSLRILSKQIVRLMDELSIDSAHFYGSSSDGAAVLGLIADHPKNEFLVVLSMKPHWENLKKSKH